MKKAGSIALPIALAMCLCLLIGLFIGRSNIGQHIFAEFHNSESIAPSFAHNNGYLDINTATADQLVLLPGIGSVLAQRIIDYRTEVGEFTAIEEIMQVDGIGTSQFAMIIDYITVGG